MDNLVYVSSHVSPHPLEGEFCLHIWLNVCFIDIALLIFPMLLQRLPRNIAQQLFQAE